MSRAVQRSKAKSIVRIVTGAGAGAVGGFLIAGPLGAAIGCVAGMTIVPLTALASGAGKK